MLTSTIVIKIKSEIYQHGILIIFIILLRQ